MSKSILGGRNTINIGTISFSDLEVDTITVDSLTASRGVVSDANKKLISTTATATEINYLSGVSSAIQSQINGKEPTISTSNRLDAVLVGVGNVDNQDFAKLTGADTLSDTIKNMITNPSSKIIQAGTNLAYNNSTTPPTLNATFTPTITADRACISNGSGVLVASAVSATELGFLDNVSSSIQTQLNSKNATITDGSLSIARTSGLQTALDAKQASITAGTNLSFSGTTLNASAATITASRVAVSNGSGAIVASDITTTELNYLDGTTSAIQTQLNSKLNTSSKEINGDGSVGEVRIKTVSATDNTSSSEGTSLSKFLIKAKFYRNPSGSVITTFDQNMFGVFCFSQSDSNNVAARCDMNGGVFRSNSTEYLSDDRLKWDETDISDATATIMKLKPQVYQKYTEYNVADPSIRPTDLGLGKKEFGFIAQEVAEIEELSHLVGDDTNYFKADMPILAVNYNGIYVLAVKAIQELKTELDTLKARIVVLEG